MSGSESETLLLVSPDIFHRREYNDMMAEWVQDKGPIIPSALVSGSLTYDEWLSRERKFESEDTCPRGMVPCNLYFLTRASDGKIVGAAHIRWRLNKELLHSGGHIGYGIRPSERGKGYGTRQLGLILDKCRERKMEKLLITCTDDNPASQKIILKNGGVLENTVSASQGELVRRYWVEL